MHLSKKTFALYTSAASSVIYALCSVFVALFPDFSTNLMSSLFHIPGTVDIGSWVTLQGVVIGVIEVALYSLVVGWVFAWVFNRSVKNN